MHKWAKEILECVKAKVTGIGLDNMDMESVCELEKWTCIADKIAETDYYIKIVDAMEESEYGEDYDWQGKKYYGGEHSGRRYHHSTPYSHTPYSPVWDESRDMDRVGHERMYYSSGMNGMNNGNSGMGNSRIGRSSTSRARYFSTKDEHMGSNDADKRARTEKLEDYFSDLKEDMTEMLKDEPSDVKMQMKQKLITMANSLS